MEQGESVVLATYDLSVADTVDVLYELWDPAGKGDHTITFYHDNVELVSYRYTGIGTESAGVMEIEARWPGIDRAKVEYLFENNGVVVLHNQLVRAGPYDYVTAGQMKYNGTSIHKKPGAMRVDVGYDEPTTGWCRTPTEGREIPQSVSCTHMGIVFDVPVADADLAVVTSKLPGAQLIPLGGGGTASE